MGNIKMKLQTARSLIYISKVFIWKYYSDNFTVTGVLDEICDSQSVLYL